jgi:hypothetical protein
MKTLKKYWLVFVLFLFLKGSSNASNLSNPTITLPPARVAIGASYHLGGYTITNDTIASLFNRIHGRVEFGPLKYVTFGIDAGVSQIEVDKFDTLDIFHGKFGFSGGAHLKFSTPSFARQMLSVIAIAQGTLFNSENEYNAAYTGYDGTGIVGLQLHIPGFGYISAGPWVYIIQGENRSYNGTTSFYSNQNNVRGWLAIDFFPRFKDIIKNKPYVSLEVSVSPKVNYSERIPVQEFSVSISIGAVTGRLYGVESDVEWTP